MCGGHTGVGKFLLLGIFVEDGALQELIVLSLVEVLKRLGVELTTSFQHFLQMVLLLGAHHSNVCGRASNAL